VREDAGSWLSAPVARCWQWACIRRAASGRPGSRAISCLVIALRVVRCHRCHSSGVWGSRSACKSRSAQSAQRPRCTLSRRRVLRSSGGWLVPRRWSAIGVCLVRSAEAVDDPCRRGGSGRRQPSEPSRGRYQPASGAHDQFQRRWEKTMSCPDPAASRSAMMRRRKPGCHMFACDRRTVSTSISWIWMVTPSGSVTRMLRPKSSLTNWWS
jgi:hypothetical protein